MALEALVATPHPDGNRIDLNWDFPGDRNYIGVRVVRRPGSYPLSPDDGVTLLTAADFKSAVDSGLKSEQVYYYMLFPYETNPPVFEVDLQNRVAAMATADQDMPGYMMSLLPAIYHRYDKDRQQLESFIELFGGQLNQFYSYASATADLQNLDKVNGHLLPLLAKWIGWKTDHKLEFSAQRAELRHAPTLYKSVGLLPTVEATVKRNSGWECRSKEFVHNIMATNMPPRLNLWSKLRDNLGVWSEPPDLLSLDYAYEGKPASTVDNNGIRWLFYHTRRKNLWEIWYKTSPMTCLPLSLQAQLQDGVIAAELLQTLNQAGLDITPAAVITFQPAVAAWEIADVQTYIIEQRYNELLAFHATAELGAMAPSLPLIVGDNTYVYKYPSVAQQALELWLFWSAYDAQQDHWQIQYRRRSAAQWLDIAPAGPNPELDNPFAEGGVYDPLPQRQMPQAIVDGSDRLWLFWLEHDGNVWRLRFNRRDGGVWQTPVSYLNGGIDPGIMRDLSVAFDSALPDERIYLFWSRMAETSTLGQMRWELAYDVKLDLALNDLNWNGVQSLPKNLPDDNYQDREPCVVLNGADVEVFWSSNRNDSGWSIWRSMVSDFTTNSWDAAELLTDGIYGQRDPLAVLANNKTWLIHRSDQGLAYQSEVYGATDTFDERYVGSTTVDVRHRQKFALWKSFGDIQRYTYDSGSNGERDDQDWISRDTIGIYLDNDTLDADQIDAGIARLKPVLSEFMPMTDRAVFIPATELHTDFVYTYGMPVSTESRYLSSTYEDDLSGVMSANVLSEGDIFSDGLDS